MKTSESCATTRRTIKENLWINGVCMGEVEVHIDEFTLIMTNAMRRLQEFSEAMPEQTVEKP